MSLTGPTPQITVWSKAYARTGFIGAPSSLKLNLRHNAVSDAEFVVSTASPYLDAVQAPGARITVDYLGSQVFSGPISGSTRRGPAGAGNQLEVTFTAVGDWRLWNRLLGWPQPGSAVGSQGTAYDTRTGPAETVAKGFAAANVARLSSAIGPVMVATDLGRGDVITVQSRMHVLTDRLFPAVDTAGIGLSVQQAVAADGTSSGLVVDAYEPATYPRTITDRSGVLVSWEQTSTVATATRAIIGGQGEGTAREFRRVIDTALEAATGDVVEVFVDARDTSVAAEQDARGYAALAENAPMTGLKVELAETPTFRYGDSLRVGDSVTLSLANGAVTLTDVVREATLTWDENGLNVVPLIGDRTVDARSLLGKALGQLQKAIRDMKAGR